MIYTEINDIKESLHNCLSPERYIHSIGVMEMSEELARKFNCDIEKAKIAGLLHDCAKCLSKEELLKYIYCLEPCEKLNTKTWHAPVGAIIAKTQYNINDEEILSAIRYHTIGKINMSDFEKIIFIADKIEHRTREKDMITKIETALYKNNNLDDAMFECFKITIGSLVKRQLPICYQTIEVYNYLLDRSKS